MNLTTNNYFQTRGSERNVPIVTGVSWSTVNTNLIASVADNGCFVFWYLAENVTKKYSVGPANLSAVACSTTDENLLATVFGGSISLVRVQSSKMDVKRLRIFQKDISHMAWQPASLNLCVTSQKGELSLWDMSLPKCIKTEKIDYNQKNTQPVHLPVLWLDDKTLLCRNGSNVVSANYETLLTNHRKIEWDTVHSLHKRPIFALARATSGNILWSFASDRTFVAFNLETKTLKESIGNLYGGCFCGAVSPHDPNLVAFGSGDGNLRVWNVSQPTGSCSVEYRNIAGKLIVEKVWVVKKFSAPLF